MRLSGLVEKCWGSENIWATNDKYCGKIMKFNTGSKFSMHFHAQKDETWYVLSGEFIVRYINTSDATIYEEKLYAGDVWHNPPNLPHQLICLSEGSVVEVSTPDSVEDNFRIAPGDSQSSRKG
jgi:mannose-6-phosphate isomerase-like protein (cupin superfamily)